ncbi:carboxymuconolactone decarboxylase family protein [Albimonas sp. CAU 1670]|uniref:carboxymuconolactone decarboxylase family protein n=1 Tax=Albimonas sp. CAU 1670 TaxID=3032599 RepID=UPI0023DA6F20|nr:carboxymuconolactone decarboxylase family protein [Albimonas sp. CAU 1670]MDF2232335.1 carboxymuconolactone decarboxylase family protein [Albimonas sp. CAU 1670]
MARLAPPALDEMTDAQKEVAEAILSGPRGAIVGPLGFWLHRPGLAAPAQEVGAYCRFGSSLPPNLSEIAICTVARVWNAQFEWYAHKNLALDAGVPIEILDAIRDRTPPPFRDEKEAMCHEFTLAVQTERTASQALYDRALAVLGRDGLVDLVAINGYYCMVSLTLNVFDADLPEGVEPEM